MKKVEKILKMEMEKVFQRYGYRIKEIDSGCFPSKLLIFNNYITLAGQPSVFSYMGKRRSQKKEENYWILRHTDFLIRIKGEDFTDKEKENLRKAYQNILRIEMKEGFLRIPYTAKKYDEKAVIKSRYSEREINYSPFIVDIVLPEEVTVDHLSEMYERFFEDELFSGKYHSFMEVHFEEKIKEKQEEMVALIAENAKTGSYTPEFDERYRTIAEEINALKEAQKTARNEKWMADSYEQRIQDIDHYLSTSTCQIQEFDNDLVRRLISTIKVESSEKLLIQFQSGIVMEQEIRYE